MLARTTLPAKKATLSTFTPTHGSILQRKCACGQHTVAGNECAECHQKRSGGLQRAAVNAGSLPMHTASPAVHDVLTSPGQPLDHSTHAFMASRFGHDFSAVRVHTDAGASESARRVNALAYTVGKDIVFRTGQYHPETREGQRLIAHELTHVMQQNGNTQLFATEPRVTHPDDTTEQEAEVAASTIMQGHSVGSLSHSGPQIARQVPPGSSSLSVQETQMIADAQFERYRVLSLALGELNSLARAMRMNPDPALLASAFGPTLAIVATWLNVGPGEPAPPTSYLGQSAGSDYFTDVLDVAVQHIRDNLACNAVVDKADPADALCAIPGVVAHHDRIFGGIYCCDRAFSSGVPYLGLALTHEYFHAIGLVHGSEPAILNIDSCAFSSTTEEKLENPYCMTGLAEHIAYGYVWWQA